MDDTFCRHFFLQPQGNHHRRYEALRAYFVEGRPLVAIADQFGYRLSSLKSMVCRFHAACSNGGPAPFFFRSSAAAPAADATGKTTTGQRRLLSLTSDNCV